MHTAVLFVTSLTRSVTLQAKKAMGRSFVGFHPPQDDRKSIERFFAFAQNDHSGRGRSFDSLHSLRMIVAKGVLAFDGKILHCFQNSAKSKNPAESPEGVPPEQA